MTKGKSVTGTRKVNSGTRTSSRTRKVNSGTRKVNSGTRTSSRTRKVNSGNFTNINPSTIGHDLFKKYQNEVFYSDMVDEYFSSNEEFSNSNNSQLSTTGTLVEALPSSIHNIQENIDVLDSKICNIESFYQELIDHFESINVLERTNTLDNTEKTLTDSMPFFQMVKQSNVQQAIRIKQIAKQSNRPYHKYLDILISSYRYKLITALATKGNICYAVKYFSNKEPEDYLYLENLLGLLKLTLFSVNREMRQIWKDNTPTDRYVLSGGNIFFVLAGVLLFLNEQHTKTHDMLNNIKKNIFTVYPTLHEGLTILFSSEEFKVCLNDILLNMSDIDCLFITKQEKYVDNTKQDIKNINLISALTLRKIMNSPYYIKLFPFLNRPNTEEEIQYNSEWTKSSMKNQSKMTLIFPKKMNIPIGLRQTSTYIEELPIYLNRIKQGYAPLTGHLGSCFDDDTKKKFKSKYGECIDLSIGSIQNEFYKHKFVYYVEHNKYYCIEVLHGELEEILRNKADDKTEKRQNRMLFLKYLSSTLTNPVVNEILRIIFEEIDDPF